MNFFGWVLATALLLGNVAAYYFTGASLKVDQERHAQLLAAMHARHDDELDAAKRDLKMARLRLERREKDLIDYDLPKVNQELQQAEKAMNDHKLTLSERATQLQDIDQLWHEIRVLKMRVGE